MVIEIKAGYMYAITHLPFLNYLFAIMAGTIYGRNHIRDRQPFISIG
jgi:hypothetical protein